MRVFVAVGIAAAVNDHRIVQHGISIDVLRLVEPVEEAREMLHVMEIDLADLRHQLGIIAMVRAVVVALGNAELREGAVAAVVRQEQGGDARRVGLKSHGEEVIHEVHVLAEVVGDAVGRGGSGIRQPAKTRGALDAPLDRAHAGEILVDFFAVARPDLPLQRARIVEHEIQQRFLGLLARLEVSLAFIGCTAAEEPFKNQPRIRLRGHRGGGRAPREVVLIGAGVAAVATAGFAHVVARKLQR